jgi:hypothetical protein
LVRLLQPIRLGPMVRQNADHVSATF